ncbi:MAG TPA: tRNA (adenosine(37)-N6)-threonylcarbamoyltransferase complex dimerization subunit type 1 TsaB [Longimicrobiales bacterium]|nr:tRNA (adenosine(37)-N6)-threonylcarbamoyltransferase complex dimerization subunit type 1 TsaB [Longimicrobiales bacterium]
MRLVLGIEAATPVGSVAVAREGTLLAEATLGLTTRHAELLLPAIDFVLGSAGVARTGLSEIVVGAGPGSFTGVRIAAATARGLAAALSVPLSAHGSLLVAAAASGVRDRPVCALFDARRGEVYAACYRFGADLPETLLEPVATRVEDVVAQLAGQDIVWTGDGAHVYADRLPDARVVPALLAVPRAAALLWLHGMAPGAARIAEPAHWQPTYLRGSGAERGVAG